MSEMISSPVVSAIAAIVTRCCYRRYLTLKYFCFCKQSTFLQESLCKYLLMAIFPKTKVVKFLDDKVSNFQQQQKKPKYFSYLFFYLLLYFLYLIYYIYDTYLISFHKNVLSSFNYVYSYIL